MSTYKIDDAFQAEAGRWHDVKFPHDSIETRALGVVEELGELARCLVKRARGVRGTHEQWTAELRAEAADVVLSLLAVAEMEGFDLARVARYKLDELWTRDVNHDSLGEVQALPTRCPRCGGPFVPVVEHDQVTAQRCGPCGLSVTVPALPKGVSVVEHPNTDADR